jgi:hypothetical protein
VQIAAQTAPRCLKFLPERFGVLVLFKDDLAPEFLDEFDDSVHIAKSDRLLAAIAENHEAEKSVTLAPMIEFIGRDAEALYIANRRQTTPVTHCDPFQFIKWQSSCVTGCAGTATRDSSSTSRFSR